MTGLVALLLGQIAQVDDLMTIRNPDSGNQAQRTEEQPRNSPTVAIARFLGSNGFRQPSADQMDNQHHDQGVEFQRERAAHHLR